MEYTVGLDSSTELGGYVEIAVGPDTRLLCQVNEHRSEGADEERRIVGTARVLGRIDGSVVDARAPIGAFAGGSLQPADPAPVRDHLESAWPGDAVVHLGQVNTGDKSLPARLRARGFSRHTFMCGQSGSGKTYTLGVVLEQLLANTSLRMIIIDPNSDYVHLGSVDPAGAGVPNELTDRLTALQSKVFVFGNGHPQSLRVLFGRLTAEQQATVLRLDPLHDAEEFAAFRTAVGPLGAEYSMADLVAALGSNTDAASARLVARLENLGISNAEIWAASPGDAMLAGLPDDWRVAVLDLGSLALARDRSIIAASTAVWLWENRHARQPVLLVIDEAHNICPSKPLDPNQTMATDLLVAIAGEGRKFGLHLLLATQRPQKLQENVLSQCDNLLLMRMNSSADITVLEEVFSHVPPGLIRQASALTMGEGLAAGPITADPLMFRTGARYTPEGGSDVPADWALER